MENHRPPDSLAFRETKRRAVSSSFSTTQHAAIPGGNTYEKHAPLSNPAKRPPDSPASRETKRRAISDNFSANQNATIHRGNTHEKYQLP
ncbi:hypothetical protein C8R48DRAFT_406714 [Suillus tomentosus]|nr:hypothetical protein C8R48DRAFT_406714 [Suillus tomentosus]